MRLSNQNPMKLKAGAVLLRCTIDLLLAFTLFAMLFLWGVKYVWPGHPQLLQFEQWAGGDNPMHFTLGLLLPWCLGVLGRVYRCTFSAQLWFFVAMAGAYSVDELFQMWLPFRSATWADYWMSLTGWLCAFISWWGFWLVWRQLQSMKNRHP